MKNWILTLSILSFFLMNCSKEDLNNESIETAKRTHFNTNSNNSGFTGEEIFLGLFLMEGQVAQSLPSLKEQRLRYRNTVDTLISDYSVLQDFHQDVITEINNIDSTYFQRLQNSVDSANPIKIDARLNEGGILFLNAIANLNSNNIKAEIDLVVNDIKASDIKFEDSEDVINFIHNRAQARISGTAGGTGVCIVFYYAFAVYVAGVIDFALAVNAAIAIDIYLAVALWGPALDNPRFNGGIDQALSSVDERLSLRKEIILSEIAMLPTKR